MHTNDGKISKDVPREAYTINEFCAAHRISRSVLYDLWDAGKGPRRMAVTSRGLISVEAARDWRREREAAAAQAKVITPKLPPTDDQASQTNAN